MKNNEDQIRRIEELSNKVAECSWSRRLLVIAQQIVSKHLKVALENNCDYDLLGTDTEKEIKNVLYLFDKLITVINDIEKTLYLIGKAPYDTIEANSIFKSSKDLYKYYLENYIIRIGSIPDVLAILANDICKWGIDAKKCYGTTIAYNTKDALVGKDVKLAMIDLLTKIIDVRAKRNEKIHLGDTDIKYFSNIVFWNDYLSKFGLKGEKHLDDLTFEKVELEIEKMINEMNEIIRLVVVFLNLLAPKIDDLIEKYDHEQAQY